MINLLFSKKRLLNFSFVVITITLTFFSAQVFAIPLILQDTIDNTLQEIADATENADSLLSAIEGVSVTEAADTFITQKGAEQIARDARIAANTIGRTIKRIRRRLKDLRQDPDFNSTEAEIRELDELLKTLKADRKELRAKNRRIKKAKSILPTGIKSLLDLEDTALEMEIFCQTTLREDIDDLKANGAKPGDESFRDTLNSLIDEVKAAEKTTRNKRKKAKKSKVRKGLNALRKRFRAVREKYEDALTFLEDIPESNIDPNVVNNTATIRNITCNLVGELQPSGFGTARVTCTFPDDARSGKLQYFADNGEATFTDFGFAQRNFLTTESPKQLSIDPCSGGFGLPVCQEAALVFEALNAEKGEVFVDVYMNGDKLGFVDLWERPRE